MDITIIPLIFNLIDVAMLAYILYSASKLKVSDRYSTTMAFFAFGMACLLVSYLYWLAYDLMRAGTRMPFAANEIGEAATTLLLGAALATIFSGRKAEAGLETIGGIIFTVVSIGLWIGWSGEWFQDIIGGAAMGYLIYITIRGLKITGTFTPKEWTGIGIVVGLLLILQIVIFFLPEGIKTSVDALCYMIMAAAVLYTFYLVKKTIGDEERPERFLCVSFGAFICSLNCMYMSAEPIYFFFDLTTTIATWFVYLGIAKVVKQQ
ncbi:MAG: hypothetical protein IKS99_02310 [Firmicutes bacterium]|nr:hypothetical protein [Bacillota bacterium]